MAAQPGAATLEPVGRDRKRIAAALGQLHLSGLETKFDVERSRVFRFAGRTFVVAFDRRFFGPDFEHLRGKRSLVAVVGLAHPVERERFEAHRLVVLDLRDAASPRLEVRRLDGSVAHAGSARIEGKRLFTSIAIGVPRIRLAGSIEGSVGTDGQIRLTAASLSVKTAPQRPGRDRMPS